MSLISVTFRLFLEHPVHITAAATTITAITTITAKTKITTIPVKTAITTEIAVATTTTVVVGWIEELKKKKRFAFTPNCTQFL